MPSMGNIFNVLCHKSSGINNVAIQRNILTHLLHSLVNLSLDHFHITEKGLSKLNKDCYAIKYFAKI